MKICSKSSHLQKLFANKLKCQTNQTKHFYRARNLLKMHLSDSNATDLRVAVLQAEENTL